MSTIHSSADVVIFAGDARDEMLSLGDEMIDSIVTSPPYGDVRPESGGAAPDLYVAWFESFMDEIERVAVPEAGFMLNLGRVMRGGEEHSYAEQVLLMLRDRSWKRLDTIIWRKTNANATGGPYLHNQHEIVYWLSRDTDAYRGYDADTRRPYSEESLARFNRKYIDGRKGDPQESDGRTPHPDGARPASVFECSVGKEKGNPHPTPMPMELARYLVSLVCPPGGTVLDPFLGSGTTARAARERGRVCFGIEQNKEWAAHAASLFSQQVLL